MFAPGDQRHISFKLVILFMRKIYKSGVALEESAAQEGNLFSSAARIPLPVPLITQTQNFPLFGPQSLLIGYPDKVPELTEREDG